MGSAVPSAGQDAGETSRSVWIRVAPGGETTCAHGATYAFWARVADPGRVLLYFQGGGGCWNAETCRSGSEWYDPDVTAEDDPGEAGGVLDLANPQNPFREWSIVFVPYCTGDVHWGDNVVTYADSLGEVRVRHKGFVNASAALAWAADRFPAPKRITVMGCSAGSVGSILFAPYARARWPDAALTQVGDAETFVFDEPVDVQTDFHAHDNFPEWIPALREIEPGSFTMERFYAGVAKHDPDATFAQVTTAHDSVQIRYFEAVAASDTSGASSAEPPRPGSWERAMSASLAAIHAAAPNFRSFVAAGHEHCATPSGDFYHIEAGGVRLRDWIEALANGAGVGDVRCTTCDVPPGSGDSIDGGPG